MTQDVAIARWRLRPDVPGRVHVLDYVRPGLPVAGICRRGAQKEQVRTQLQALVAGVDATSAFFLRLRFAIEGWKRLDLDNMQKFIFDACTGAVWSDDVQVNEVEAYVERDADFSETRLSIFKAGVARRIQVCPVCQRQFRPPYNCQDQVCCSTACRGETQKVRVVLECVRCGASVLRRPAHIRVGNRTFCDACKRRGL